MTPFTGEVSNKGFEEAKERYDMPEASSLEEIKEKAERDRWRKRARELGLPEDTPVDDIKRAMRERFDQERPRDDHAA